MPGDAVVSHQFSKETRGNSTKIFPWYRSGSEPENEPVKTHQNVTVHLMLEVGQSPQHGFLINVNL